MPLSESYLEYIRDRLSILGKISIRKMFGGAGVMCPVRGAAKPKMFAVIDDDQIYFKADDSNREDYTSRGLSQWVYDPAKPEKSRMPYFPVPEDVLEDDDLLREWGKKAMAVASRSAALRAPKRPSDGSAALRAPNKPSDRSAARRAQKGKPAPRTKRETK